MSETGEIINMPRSRFLCPHCHVKVKKESEHYDGNKRLITFKCDMPNCRYIYQRVIKDERDKVDVVLPLNKKEKLAIKFLL